MYDMRGVVGSRRGLGFVITAYFCCWAVSVLLERFA